MEFKVTPTSFNTKYDFKANNDAVVICVSKHQGTNKCFDGEKQTSSNNTSYK